VRRFRVEVDPDRADAARVLQLALDQLPSIDPEPPWQRVLFALGNRLGDHELGALGDDDRAAIERFAEGVDGWRGVDGLPLLRFVELR
jgi:hypothetical protein